MKRHTGKEVLDHVEYQCPYALKEYARGYRDGFLEAEDLVYEDEQEERYERRKDLLSAMGFTFVMGMLFMFAVFLLMS